LPDGQGKLNRNRRRGAPERLTEFIQHLPEMSSAAA
jgi:hypothetical protein